MELDKLNLLDPLSNLPNRYFLSQKLPQFILESEQSCSKLGIFMVDIDNFKDINDTYGHLTGDKVIKEVSEILKRCIRVKEGDVAVRYGGDEFVIFLQKVSFNTLEVVGNRIVKEIKDKIFKDHKDKEEVHITISGGFSIYPDDSKDGQELINQADKALYFSKGKGKNRIASIKEVTEDIITQRIALNLFPCPKFIDREKESAKLKDVFSFSISSKVSFALVKSKTGIGKKRLGEEFIKNFSPQEVISFKIVCSNKHISQPYYVLSLALENFFKNNEIILEALANSLPLGEIKALGELMPLLNTFIPDKPKERDEEESRSKSLNLFKGFRNIFSEISQFHPVLLFFSDIQWLDKPAFELLNYFLNWEFTRKMMIYAAFCEDEPLDKYPNFSQFLSQQKGRDNFFSIDLNPFTLQESREFITNTLAQINPSEKFYEEIYKITEGNPLFIEEILKYLIESRNIFYKGNEWQIAENSQINIPSSLEDTLKRRFRKLDKETREALAQAVVMGNDFQVDILREAIKKNQGHILELLDRARDKGFIRVGTDLGSFNINPFVQKAIYEEVEPAKREEYHRGISQIIENVYKEDHKQALGDLAYHYRNISDSSKLKTYEKEILNNSHELFNEDELNNYLEELKEPVKEDVPSSIEIQKISTEVSPQLLDKAVDFLRFIAASFESIELYPAGNELRKQSIKRVYAILKDILADTPTLTVSEVERIILVNTKRMPAQKERLSFINTFITLMVEKDIKAIQFHASLEEREIEIFLTILAQKAEELRLSGGIAKLMDHEKITNIKISAHQYAREAASSHSADFKEKIFKAVLVDFLKGKNKLEKKDVHTFLALLKQNPDILAKQLTETAKREVIRRFGDSNPQEEAKVIGDGMRRIVNELLPGGWQNNKRELVNLISSFPAPIKSELLTLMEAVSQDAPLQQLIENFSDEEITQVIMSAGTQADRETFLLNMYDLFDKFVSSSSSERKERFDALLEKKLEAIRLNKSEIALVTHKDFNSLSLQERIEAIFLLPPAAYPIIGKEKMKNFLEKLVEEKDRENLSKIITHFITCFGEGKPQIKKMILELIGEAIPAIPQETTEFDYVLADLSDFLNKQLKEADFAFYEDIVENIGKSINWFIRGRFKIIDKESPLLFKRFINMYKLLIALYQNLLVNDSSEGTQEKKRIVEDCAARIPKEEMIKMIILQLKTPSLDYDKAVEDILARFKEIALPLLIDTILDLKEFSFENSLYRYKISFYLKSMGSSAIEEIKKYLSLPANEAGGQVSKEDILRLMSLVEIVSYMKDGELVEALGKLANHKDTDIKKEIIFSLSKIDTSESKKILIDLCEDSDTGVANLAKKVLKK